VTKTTREFASLYDSIILEPELRRYYGECDYYNAGYRETNTASPKQAGNALIGRLLTNAPPDSRTILDLACGLGETTRQIQEHCREAEVIGVNISARQLQFCRQRSAEAELIQMDACELGFFDASIDLIVCVEAAFHFNTRLDFFSEAARVLRPGGVLAVSDILFGSAEWAAGWSVPRQNLDMDQQRYRSALIDAGFTSVEIEDCTDACWLKFCESLAGWFWREHRRGAIDSGRLNSGIALVEHLRSGVVRNYLLVTATR